MRHDAPVTDAEVQADPPWHPDRRELLAGAIAWWEWNTLGGGVLVGLLPGGELRWLEGTEPHPNTRRVCREARQTIADLVATKRAAIDDVDDGFRDALIADLAPIAATFAADARARHDATLALAKHPSAIAAARLVELLADSGSGLLDARFFSDDDPEPFHVAATAAEVMSAMRGFGIPHVLGALPTAKPDQARLLIRLFERVPPEHRFALADATHAAMLEWAERLAPGTVANLQWERDFARRVRTGELAGEALWRERFAAHPIEDERGTAIERLVTVARDPPAFALELVALLDDPSRRVQSSAARALGQLPCVLPPAVVRTLAASASKRPSASVLMRALARYGEPAAALAPYCLQLLQPLRDPGPQHEGGRRVAADVLNTLDDAGLAVRPQLLDLMLTADETHSMSNRPIRVHLAHALGDDPARLARELGPRIRAALASPGPLSARVSGPDAQPVGEAFARVKQATPACVAIPFLAPHAGDLVDVLLPYLDVTRPHPLVVATCIAIGKLGESGRIAVPRLAELVADLGIRHFALLALEYLGPVAADALPALLALPKSDSQRRTIAAITAAKP